MIQEATPQQDLYAMPPLQVPEVPSLPDTLILITGEEIIGQIEGSPAAKVVTIRTADGNAIAVPQERIEKIERKK